MKKIAILFCCIFFSTLCWTQSTTAAKYQLCNITNFLAEKPNEAVLREELYYQLIGVVDELGEYRNRFLQKAHLVDLFPTAYYHTTLAELLKIRANIYKDPIEKMQQMLVFYAAYRKNRIWWEQGSSKLEYHWKNHFTKADVYWAPKNEQEQEQEAYLLSLRSIMSTGIMAHVTWDFPRAIRHAWKTQPSNNYQVAKKDFDATTTIFKNTESRTLEDMITAFQLGAARQTILQFGTFLAPNVSTLRQIAWKKAFNGQPLVDLSKNLMLQPHLDYQKLYEKGVNSCQKNIERVTLFLLDTSGSMEENQKMRQAIQSVSQTISSMQQNAKHTNIPEAVAILSFAGECAQKNIAVTHTFTQDLTQIERALQRLPKPAGRTPLPQAVSAAKSFLNNYLEQQGLQEGTIVLLSDGISTCGAIRPTGVYTQGPRNSSNFATNAIHRITIKTIGFDIQPGSTGELDLQYLSNLTNGQYFNALDQSSLTRAFQKQQQLFLPKQLIKKEIMPPAQATFMDANIALLLADYKGAHRLYQQFIQEQPNNLEAVYNLGLVYEAQGHYLKAKTQYQQAAKLTTDDSLHITLKDLALQMESDQQQQIQYQLKLVENDLAYLEQYYQQLMNQNHPELATAFLNFIKEKIPFYQTLPEQFDLLPAPFKENLTSMEANFMELSKFTNSQQFDKHATAILAMAMVDLDFIVTDLKTHLGK